MKISLGDGGVAMILSFAVNLSFVETVAYYTLLNRPTDQLPPGFIATTVAVGVAGWLLLAISFLGAPGQLKRPLHVVYGRIQWAKDKLGSSIGLLFLLIPALFIGVFALDLLPETLKVVLWGKLREAGVLIALWIAVTALAWYVAQLLKALGRVSPGRLDAVLADWSLGIRLSVAHFVLYATFGWYSVAPYALPHKQQVAFTFAFAKDLFLLWIIALLLFTSLFKLGHHRVLVTIFQSVRGYLQFVLICGIIAILAIWADFRVIGSEPISQMFPEEWKQELVLAHTYVRDIGLLLAPIAALLVWVLNRVADELKQPSETAGA